MTPISKAALQTLAVATCEDHKVTLNSGQLTRELYEEVNEVLKRLGGKWSGGKTQAHLFDYDPAIALTAILESKEMPPKNPLAYFPTPADVADEVVEEADLSFMTSDMGWKILEPSAGRGDLLDAIKRANPELVVDCVELDPLNASFLRAKGYNPTVMNFLHYKPGAIYDRVVMNPPFTEWREHIKHAHSLLKRNGKLVSIVPDGIRYAGSGDFRKWAAERDGDWTIKFDAGAFKDAGTNVSTRLLTLEQEPYWKDQPYGGFETWHEFTIDMYVWNGSAVMDRYERKFLSGFLRMDPKDEPTLAVAFSDFIDSILEDLWKMGEGVARSDGVMLNLYQKMLGELNEKRADEGLGEIINLSFAKQLNFL